MGILDCLMFTPATFTTEMKHWSNSGINIDKSTSLMFEFDGSLKGKLWVSEYILEM